MAAGNSNYPNGFPQGVTIKGVPLVVTNPGKVFWVSNATTLSPGDRAGSDANKGTFNSPFATLNYAVTQCVANRGDVIVIKPGHAESITAATGTGIAIAGVAIIGLGSGSNRPTFTYTTANTATIAVSAANVSITNCRFVANFLSISSPITLTTAANFTLQSCSFTETSGVLNFLNIVKSTGAANTVDGLTILDTSWIGLGTTSVNSFVLTANDINGLNLQRNYVNLARTADAPIYVSVTAGVLTALFAEYNIGISKQTATTGGSFTNVAGTTSTGVLSRNFMQTLTTGSDAIFTTTVGLAAFENYVSGVIGASGFIIPARDS